MEIGLKYSFLKGKTELRSGFKVEKLNKTAEPWKQGKMPSS
jgi:hypothetical protein